MFCLFIIIFLINVYVFKRKSDAEVAPNDAGSDSSSDANVSPHAQHHIIQFEERKSLIGKQILYQNTLVLVAFE